MYSLVVSLCCTTLLADESIGSPPPDLAGVWEVVKFEFPLADKERATNVNFAKPDLFVIAKDYAIISIGYRRTVLDVAEGRLSDYVAVERGYRAKYHNPMSVIFDEQGNRTDERVTDPIVFEFDKDSKRKLKVTFHLQGKAFLVYHAQRISKDDASSRISTLLQDTICCSKPVRSMLQDLVVSSSEDQR